MLFGLGLGLVVAVGVYMSGPRRTGAVPQTRPAPAQTRPEPRPAAPAEAPAAEIGAGAEDDAPATPRFEFYEVLPQYEVVIPEIEDPVRGTPADQPIERPGVYVLQVGSFRALADADRRQAQIALLGIESKIQRVTIDDAVYHRVRIGPITEPGEINRIRSRLRSERIDSLLIELPD